MLTPVDAAKDAGIRSKIKAIALQAGLAREVAPEVLDQTLDAFKSTYPLRTPGIAETLVRFALAAKKDPTLKPRAIAALKSSPTLRKIEKALGQDFPLLKDAKLLETMAGELAKVKKN